MNILTTAIAGVHVIETQSRDDERGSFMRLFCAEELEAQLDSRRILQINHSRTLRRGTVRGFHFQRPPHAEMKFVRCLRGKVWDVALDLRMGSPTYLKWHAEELSEKNRNMLVIPEGCAHGFQAVEDGSELLYLHTQFYAPGSEGGVRFDDPAIAISWPLAPEFLSQRDRSYPMLGPDFEGLSL